MSLFQDIKGIIFDYGGTIDTDSVHWSEVLWRAYRECGFAVDKNDFREAYVHAERTLACQPLIRPDHNMLDLLRIKVDIETRFLMENHRWNGEKFNRKALSEAIAGNCYDYVLHTLETSREVIRELAARYPLVLVSNFYGNINAILKDFRLEYFQDVIESAVVGVRKPDPRIFQLGVDALGLEPQQVAVVGDSFTKDIAPAASLGCKTVWVRGIGWGGEKVDEALPTAIISHLSELTTLFI